MVPLLVLASLVFLCFGSIVIWTLITGISPMPSTQKAVSTMTTALEAVLAKTDRKSGKDAPLIMEAGSGWGTVIFHAARAAPGGRFIGYELSPLPYLFSSLAGKLSPNRDRITFKRDSFEKADLSGIDVILCYLHPAGMNKLQRKVESDIRGTVYIISNNFQFHSWKPILDFPVHDVYRSRVYVYKMIYV